MRIRIGQAASMVWSLDGPTETVLTGTPARSAMRAGGRSHLFPAGLHLPPDLPLVLSGKRARAHPSDVSLGHADHSVHFLGAEPGAYERAAGDGIRGCHERVGAVVE